MSGRGESPTFAMFCTIDIDDDWTWPFLFAVVADEIEAVDAFHDHVAEYDREHVPFIHMEAMRDEWRVGICNEAVLDPARNLFRQPAEVTS